MPVVAQPDVVVTVGTDHHPFPRLLGWIDRWAAERPEVTVFVQRGHTAAPAHARSEPFVTPGDLEAMLATAAAVVCHGGPGSIMEARAAGLRPLVVPRDPDLGEHVDGHQLTFTAALEREGLIDRPTDEAALGGLLDEALRAPTRLAPTGDAVPEAVRRIGDLIDGLVTGP